jgi:hypothetical protein
MLSEIAPHLILYTQRYTRQLMLNIYDTHAQCPRSVHSQLTGRTDADQAFRMGK